MKEQMVKLSQTMLEEADACGPGIDKFVELFGADEVELVWSPLAYLMMAKLFPDYAWWLTYNGVWPQPDLSGMDLRGLDLRGADLDDVLLKGADLRGVDLSWASMLDANLQGADLSGANLRGVRLDGSDLTGANLSGASLAHTVLNKATLLDVTWTDCSLSWTCLEGAVWGEDPVPPGWELNRQRLTRGSR